MPRDAAAMCANIFVSFPASHAAPCWVRGAVAEAARLSRDLSYSKGEPPSHTPHARPLLVLFYGVTTKISWGQKMAENELQDDARLARAGRRKSAFEITRIGTKRALRASGRLAYYLRCDLILRSAPEKNVRFAASSFQPIY